MPLFKLAAALESATIDGDVVLIAPLVSGTLGAECSLVLPRARVAGKFQDIANGEILLHSIATDGSILVGSLLSGDAALPRLSLYGEMKTDSEIVLGRLQAGGVVDVPGIIDGGLRFKTISVDGVIVEDAYLDGDVDIPALGVFGKIAPISERTLAGSVLLRKISMFGYASNFIQPVAKADGILKYADDRRHI